MPSNQKEKENPQIAAASRALFVLASIFLNIRFAVLANF